MPKKQAEYSRKKVVVAFILISIAGAFLISRLINFANDQTLLNGIRVVVWGVILVSIFWNFDNKVKK